MSEIMGIGPPPSALSTSNDGFCISGSTRSLSVGSVGSGSEPSTPTRLSEVLTAKSFRKAIAKKGNSLKSLKSLIIEYEPAAKKEDTPETTESKDS